jgi:hypothetical protein
MAFDEHGRLGLAHLAGRDAENQRGEPVRVRFELETVQAKEHERRHEAGALVPIEEWMVPNEVEQIGGGHLGRVGMQVAAAERGLRHGDCRLEETDIADSVVAAIPFDLVRVKREHFVEGQKCRALHYSASRRNTPE